MCGIIAVLRRKSRRQPLSVDSIRQALAAAERAVASGWSAPALDAAAQALAQIDRELKGVPGLWTLLQHQELAGDLRMQLQAMQAQLAAFERSLDAIDVGETVDPALEQRNQALVRLKDALWAVLRDRV